jgi:hypothetical protein
MLLYVRMIPILSPCHHRTVMIDETTAKTSEVATTNVP